MSVYIKNPVYGLLTCHNMDSRNKVEKFGDQCLDFLSCIMFRRSLWVFNQHGGRKVYNAKILEDSSKSISQGAFNVFKAVISSPIILTGVVCKILCLFDSDTRNAYFTPSFCVSESFDQFLEAPEKYVTLTQVLEAPEKYVTLTQVLEAPEKYVTLTQDLLYIGNYCQLPPFSECACAQTGTFDRTKNQRRQNIEKSMLENALTSYPTDSTYPLRYLSLGSGRMLQDLINIGKLIKAGYKSISIFFIEPKLSKHLVNYFSAFINDYAKKHGSRVVVFEAKSMKDHIARFSQKKMDIISVVDFDKLLDKDSDDALLLAQKILSSKGKMYLGYNYCDLTLGIEGIEKIQTVIGKDDVLKIIQEDMIISLAKSKQKHETIHYTYFGFESFILSGSQFLFHLLNNGYHNIQINIISETIKWKDDSITNYIKLLNANAKVSYSIIKDEETYFQKLNNFEIQNDLVVHFGFSARSEEGFTEKLTSYKKASVSSAIYMNSGGGFWKFQDSHPSILYAANEQVEEQLRKYLHL